MIWSIYALIPFCNPPLVNSFLIARTESTMTASTPASICFLTNTLSSLSLPYETQTNPDSLTTLLSVVREKGMHLTRRKHLNTLHSETMPSMFHLLANRIACCRLDARISAIKEDPESVRNRIGILGYISMEESRTYLFQRQHHTNIRMKRRKDDIPTIQIIIHHFQYYHQSNISWEGYEYQPTN